MIEVLRPCQGSNSANHFNFSSEKIYVGWLYQFIIFYGQRHPKDIDFEFDEIIIKGSTVISRLMVLLKCGIKKMTGKA